MKSRKEKLLNELKALMTETLKIQAKYEAFIKTDAYKTLSEQDKKFLDEMSGGIWLKEQELMNTIKNDPEAS